MSAARAFCSFRVSWGVPSGPGASPAAEGPTSPFSGLASPPPPPTSPSESEEGGIMPAVGAWRGTSSSESEEEEGIMPALGSWPAPGRVGRKWMEETDG